MSAPRNPCRRIVVVGGGQVGVLAAAALRQAMPVSQVVLVGQQPNPASFADFAPTSLPNSTSMHERLGLEESEIVLKAGGSYRLVTRFQGWSAAGEEGLFSYGETLDPTLKTAFAREWGGTRQLGSNDRRQGSIAQMLAEAGRFAPPPPDQQTPLSEVDYALRWNPAAYRDLLIERAQALGVDYIEGQIEAVEIGEGASIAAIRLAGQGRVEADLFVDCSGPAATLSASHPDFALIDWSDTLPTRMVYVGRPIDAVIALEDRVSLVDTGWVTQVAGRDGLHTMLGTGEGVDRDAALATLGAPALAAINLSSGRIAEPWLGNVIAIGDASARFEPVGPYHLDLAHRQIELLLEMLPGKHIEPLERDEYNRRSIMMMEAVHETLAIHFAARRAQTIFGKRPLPGRVADELDQFRRRGRIPFREEDPLLAQERFALLVALGFTPGLPPAAHNADAAAEEQAHRDFAARAQAAIDFAPPYAQWLASVSQQSPAPAG
ncbi:FAD-dependent oxidoreductase [Qipengyuania sp. 902]|uniref:FAD-dependent oxidoreductase n=1 Tax=Qipengyuania sp. 902 TaxID=3417565 RepID=UPI003EBF8082